MICVLCFSVLTLTLQMVCLQLRMQELSAKINRKGSGEGNMPNEMNHYAYIILSSKIKFLQVNALNNRL